MNDSEKLETIKQYVNFKDACEYFDKRHSDLINELDGMARVLGFSLNWKHGPKVEDQIIYANLTSFQEKVMLDTVELLRSLDEEENKLYDAFK